jgi:hypothetical protein
MEKKFTNTAGKIFCTALATVFTVLLSLQLSAVPLEAALALPGEVIINEILYDPSTDNDLGDANYDGTRDAYDDEFVELVNITDAAVEISGFELSDSDMVRHEFPSGTVIPAGHSIVVYGGGDPLLSVWNRTIVQTASSTALSLNNAGDTVTLTDGQDSAPTVIDWYTYSGSGSIADQSITRSPDLGDSWVAHSTVHYNGDLFSPGFRLDGVEFGDPVPIPGAVWLLGSGLLGLIGIRKKLKK